ncbi:hypothetical protein K505DRAFT_361512 [Melanomma pulvis-pyrius CBS 109.77]|uniref:Uncharacterized protein n=1 Tax=Melanomma pulvis-pyrius CBS 109.77 TaxID=1314802 RepID=A0A6A6XE16_9PLEO|nr:hypothetical protein K505DRAFT_361512 [Melanomma pulvis-pyrius CBS 109.77]
MDTEQRPLFPVIDKGAAVATGAVPWAVAKLLLEDEDIYCGVRRRQEPLRRRPRARACTTSRREVQVQRHSFTSGTLILAAEQDAMPWNADSPSPTPIPQACLGALSLSPLLAPILSLSYPSLPSLPPLPPIVAGHVHHKSSTAVWSKWLLSTSPC